MKQHKQSGMIRTRYLFITFGLLLALVAPPVIRKAHAAAIIPVNAGDDLQQALDAAQPGDTLLLEAGATFIGNFVLPKKSGANTGSNAWITIRSAADDKDLPAAGTRINPSFADRLPKLVSPNQEAALRTTGAARRYRLIGLEFTVAPEVRINFGIVRFGDGDETEIKELPRDLVIERCYIHGQPLADIARGVALNSINSTIVDSHISECHGIGFDTQAICGWNGPGPFKIVNNYLEGAGENVLFGGADPKIADLVPSDIEFRQNHLAKPVAWRDGILPKPRNLTALGSFAATGGALGALTAGVTYYYRVAARARAGASVTATSAASDEVSLTLLPGESSAQLHWDNSERATAFRIYRTTDAPTAATRNWVYYEVAAAPCESSAMVCPFLDSGAANFVSGSAPPSVGTRWSVKNIFELKNARRVHISGNIFENNWVDAQAGVAILFTVRNQDGRAPWSTIEDVTFENNLVRHTAAAINILGRDNNQSSQQVKNLVIHNNLFVDINGKNWGNGNGVFLTITEVEGIAITHNTVLQTGNIVSAYGVASSRIKFVNNILMHNAFGIIGDGSGTGKDTLDRYLPGKKFRANAFIGGRESLYPATNFFFAALDDVGFVDAASGDYELAPTSPLKGRATTGRDVGCDLAALRVALGAQAVRLNE